MSDFLNILDSVKRISVEAGKIILSYYNDTDIGSSLEIKPDNSPVTIADKKSSDFIIANLKKLTPEFPVISEEEISYSYKERKNFKYFWLVDPLDGTKEFIKRNGEFTVNIALIHRKFPILGVVYAPVSNTLYWGYKNNGSYRMEDNIVSRLKVSLIKENKKNIRIVTSRSHLDNETLEYCNKFEEPVLIKRGSSLKFMDIASGKADLYFRFASIKEWDTAASHIIVEEAGGQLKNIANGKNIYYNKKNLKIPGFLVSGNLNHKH